MCLQHLIADSPRESAIARSAPDAHLALTVDDMPGQSRRLVEALLRVDLGARVSVDERSGLVQMEGRFRASAVIAAIERLGYRLLGVEERPLTPRSLRAG